MGNAVSNPNDQGFLVLEETRENPAPGFLNKSLSQVRVALAVLSRDGAIVVPLGGVGGS